jgi:hypothetical protein
MGFFVRHLINLAMNWKTVLGLVACTLLVASCFMRWAWYPDIEMFFTGFFSKENYYGRPGILLSCLAGIAFVMYLVRRPWSYRLNLIVGAIVLGYAITSFLRFSSAYDGFLPEKQPGIWLMLMSAGANLVAAVVGSPATAAPKATDATV